MKLDHPAIAKVMDHLVESGRDYLLLEYVPGTSLRQHIRLNGPSSEKQILHWAKELAATLSYLHELSPPVVHRDLTPDNVVLRSDGALVPYRFWCSKRVCWAGDRNIDWQTIVTFRLNSSEEKRSPRATFTPWAEPSISF